LTLKKVQTISDAYHLLARFCDQENYCGYDPYDGLNSRLFQKIPFFRNSRFIRLVWIQFFKRSPINLRRFVGIQKEYNPKAIGLFLSAFCALYKQHPKVEYLSKIKHFLSLLESMESKGYSGSCWGYNFDWESRAFFQPKFTPTIVATSFIADAIMDAYDVTKDENLLNKARSACEFMLKDLNRSEENQSGFAFSYSPLDQSIVYNASLLGARLFARVYAHTKEPILFETAHKVVRYCCHAQQKNGSWAYGALPFHQWIDSFHTGYNLECLADYAKYTGDHQFNSHMEKGFDFYIQTFFMEDGTPKYYSHKVFPIDIHAPAQLVITLIKLNRVELHRELVEKVLCKTIETMQDKKTGYFHYQINRWFKSKIPYMRWSQAWMFVSLGQYLLHTQSQQLQHENLV
jgi:rhamnogalacturonyl hydrolase YesR